jgi:predicted small secreted protein
MKRFITIALLAVATLGATGCNTLKGIGADFKKAGDAVSGAVKN